MNILIVSLLYNKFYIKQNVNCIPEINSRICHSIIFNNSEHYITSRVDDVIYYPDKKMLKEFTFTDNITDIDAVVIIN